jgi:hypothetical protein
LDFFDAHWFPLKGNAKWFATSSAEIESPEAKAHKFHILLNELVLPRIFETNARFRINRCDANTAFTLFRIRMDDFHRVKKRLTI